MKTFVATIVLFAGVAMATTPTSPVPTGICGYACYPGKVNCPSDMNSTKLGTCWMCCRGTQHVVQQTATTLYD
ncbi:hypothetical protein XA68_18552 [Ophiocordyceps unilateralis]|uniref:Uncharacterized protein n=1 Tax=Ophiocordyceps unilateralis TaxID=268505 RepID=A0A2A9PJ50_OPHUN|nr:hypothetical protein XA68_18552 [Ophiocordyceps unilateralis]